MKAEGPRVRIEELRLVGFRGFENARLALDDVTVLVGRNGAGKSTIVDAFELLRETLTDSLENALERRGGILAVLHKGPRAGKSLSIAVKLRVSDPSGHEDRRRLYGFTLQLRSGGRGYVTRRSEPGSDVEAETLNALRTSLLTYKLHPAAIRAEPTIGRAIPLSRDGSNVGDVLKRLERSPDDVAWIVKHLGAITPGIVGVRAGTAVGRRIVQFFQSAGGAHRARFEIGDMSDGTLRALAILLALRQKPTPALVGIDEIEDSVHPAALAVLLDAVAASSERCQVLLTSHSPEALGHPVVTAKRVRVVDWKDGRSEIYRLNKGAAEAARPPRSVGTLLRSNALFTEEAPERVEGDFFEAG